MNYFVLFLEFTVLVSTVFGSLYQNSTFEEYISYYNIEISPSEYGFRKNIFMNEQQRIIQHNKQKTSWVESFTPMTILSSNEKKQHYGYSKSIGKILTSNTHNSLRQTLISKIDLNLLPDEVDWRKLGVVSAVKSQGSCGSCWAFASTAVIESHVAINSSQLFDLSPQQIATCAPNPFECGGKGNCQGATAELAFDYVANSIGLFDEFQLPYTEYYGVESKCELPNTTPKAKISGFVKLEENNYSQLMYAVATFGPIAVSVDASTWHSYSGGIFNGCNQSNPDINHAVVLMGYGTDQLLGLDYWLVRNSWSASWGESGYIRLLRKNNNNQEEENCGLDITPQDGTACIGDDTPVKVCGTCGILYDSSYPIGATVI
jgi:cathepsin L